MVLHYVPTTPEEEELALALAISASLSANKGGAAASRPAPGAANKSSSRPSSFTNGAARASASSGASTSSSQPLALSPLLGPGSASAYPTVPAIGSPTHHGPRSPARPSVPLPQTSSPLLPQRPTAGPSYPSYYPPVPAIHAQPPSYPNQHPPPPAQPPQQQHYAGLRPGHIQAPGAAGGASGASAAGPSSSSSSAQPPTVPARRRWDLPPGPPPYGPGAAGAGGSAGAGAAVGAAPPQPRRRWDLGGVGGSAGSAPASPKGAAAGAASSGGSFSSRHGSPSRAAAAAAVRQSYPTAAGPSSSSHQPPAQQRPLPPIGRSKSATGPNGLMGVGAAAGGGGGFASGGAAAAGQRPALPPPPPLFSDPDACAGCGKGFGGGGLFGAVLGLGGGSGYVTGMNRKWHPDCFKCGFCAEPISSGRGAFAYQMHPGDPRPYHTDCYKHVHHPVCAVCGTFIPAGPDGRIAFKEAGFWRERYCHSHTEADIVRCCACSRLQKKGEEWAPLPDGRPLCLGCLGSVVLDTADAQPLYGELMDWYRADMRLPHAGAKPPLLLVDGPTLNEHAAREGRDDSAGAPVFHVRGLCVATVYTSIPSIRRGSGGVLHTIATALSQSAAAALGGASVRCDVKCILLLYGLPRLLTGSIMAHELMHAWLRQAGCVGLPLRVEEGLCQLMACLWLDRQHELLAGNPDEQRLASFFSYQIRTDTSEVYGDGFRDAMEAFQSHGLTNVVRNVQLYGRFTPP